MANVINMVVGKPKAGKSQFVAGVVASLLTGEPLGGLSGLEPTEMVRRVLWLGTDSGWRAQAKARLSQYGDDVPPRVLFPDEDALRSANLKFTASGDPTLATNSWINMVRQMRDEHEVDVLVVDHLLGIVASRGVNEDQAIAPFLDALAAIAELGVTVILVHHVSNKAFGNQEGTPMGHTLIEAAARLTLAVRPRRRGTQEIQIMGNETPPMTMAIGALDATLLTVQSIGLTAEATARTTRSREGGRRARQRGDIDIRRTQYLLDGPTAARANQSVAGRHLERGGRQVMGDATNGRQVVRRLIDKGLLAVQGEALAAGPNWSGSAPAAG